MSPSILRNVIESTPWLIAMWAAVYVWWLPAPGLTGDIATGFAASWLLYDVVKGLKKIWIGKREEDGYADDPTDW